MAEDLYEEIGVTRDADEKAIKAAIDKRRKPLHKAALAGDEAANESLARLAVIQDVLTDAEQRAEHDAQLREPVVVATGDLYDHRTVYHGEVFSGFGRGRLVSSRTVADGELLTIRFGDADKEIVASHRGLTRVLA